MAILAEANRLVRDALADGLAGSELVAWLVFGGYFALIAACFVLVFRSILHGVEKKRLFEGRPFWFLRTGVVGLGVTWYFMIKFMLWSYQRYAARTLVPTLGKWLLNTQLFEQAWGEVCSSPTKWWWSSWICTWSVVLTAIIWRESAARGIKYPWAYMLLGMSVAISVATSLFLCAIYLHPRLPGRLPARAPVRLYIPLFLSLYTVFITPATVGTPTFLSNVLMMHGCLIAPLMLLGLTGAGPSSSSHSQGTSEASDSTPPASRPSPEPLLSGSFTSLYTTLTLASAITHYYTTLALVRSVPRHKSIAQHLFDVLANHPAQSSISTDVICVAFTVASWWVVSGSITAMAAKSGILGAVAIGAFVRVYGVNWKLVASLVPLSLMFAVGLMLLGVSIARTRNAKRRAALLDRLGLRENTVEPGTSKEPPRKVGRRMVVGFWHPYCNSGGGGERVLWAAIAYMQRTQPGTVCLVYSGDYPDASKAAILQRAQDRFSITINPKTLQFVPLPSRKLISDGYWKRFTLLGQSLGSVYLAYEGLCGKEGLWGDVFIDTMGHGFTFPFVRLLAGSSISIGAYIHYPTVSDDMVRRVREGLVGIESGSESSTGWRRQVKLAYYHVFTTLYATSLLFAETIMCNSSWTHAHIQRLLARARGGTLAGVFLLDELSERKRAERGEPVVQRRCEVVFPPCDTGSLTGFKLEGRGESKGIVSLAQFRPEKDQAKQLHALAVLFTRYPQYRKQGVRLTLMGGVRDEGDAARLEGLRDLAKELGVQDEVEFLVNAPYAEVVRRLGAASVGLNTMQDEHFGINVVEFMAAGLTPVVHASAGPKLDIVVPYKGQVTGYHATDAASFAEAIHTALSLGGGQQVKLRRAARALAAERFSTAAFEAGWEGGWGALRALAEERAEMMGEKFEGRRRV